jgi:hypothetical protein
MSIKIIWKLGNIRNVSGSVVMRRAVQINGVGSRENMFKLG